MMITKLEDFLQKDEKIIVADTNIIIDIEQEKYTDIDILFLNEIQDKYKLKYITEISFCELICGCRNLHDFEKNCKILSEYEFNVYSTMSDLTALFSSIDDYKGKLKTENDFNKFKSKVIELRNSSLFYIYYFLFQCYSSAAFLLLLDNDKKYWEFPNAFITALTTEKESLIETLTKKTYTKIINDKKESKYLIKDYFIELLVQMLSFSKQENYSKDEVRLKLEKALTPKNFAKYFEKEEYSYKHGKVKNIHEQYISIIRKHVVNPLKDDSWNTFLVDASCYLTSKMIFNGLNFKINDLIDLSNFRQCATSIYEVHYFTNDLNKWGEFIEIEKRLSPNIKFFINK